MLLLCDMAVFDSKHARAQGEKQVRIVKPCQVPVCSKGHTGKHVFDIVDDSSSRQ